MPNKPKPGTHTRGIRMEDELWHELQREAKARGETASDVVRRALVAYLGGPVAQRRDRTEA